MEKLSKYYTSACGSGNGNFLAQLGFTYTKDIREASLVIFGGGADIEPETYGETAGSSTGTSPRREEEETRDFREAFKRGIKMVGICRGFQFLCAKAGGKLIQDVSGHSGTHSMTTSDGITVNTNSIHHQMVNPYAIKNKHDYTILSWSTKRRSSKYLGARDKSILLPWDFKEIESAYFPKINALGYQYHPKQN